MSPFRLSPTSLSQFVRFENCERFLRFRLVPEDAERLQKKWEVTIQPLTPLLKEAGAEFERDIVQKLEQQGETVIDLSNKGLEATVSALKQISEPTLLFQPTLEAPLGDYFCSGRCDILRVSRDPKNHLNVLIADIKATRHERTEHRLQVATYARIFQKMAEEYHLSLADLRGAILTMSENGDFPEINQNTPTFDLDIYFKLLDRMMDAEDAIVKRIASQPFEANFYHLSYKCDGCLYNALCMLDAAERLDLSLIPHLSPVEKRVLNEVGIKTLPQLAALMELPAEHSSELQPNPSQQENLDALKNRWPVSANLPLLVQRARAALRNFDPNVDSRPFLFGAGFGSLPSEEEYPDLVKIFLDAQRDYLQDRLYMVSALVVGPKGSRPIVRCAEQIPNEAIERELLVHWVREVITAVREVALGDQAYLHLYCFNRYDQKVLLEALKRHLTAVSAIPAFFDLMTQSPALNQPIISFLFDEVKERFNFGRVCAPLHDVARWLGFDWKDEKYEYFTLFRARLFDNRRRVQRAADGSLQRLGQSQAETAAGFVIESASRFNSQIPLEYAYAAWGALPEDLENPTLLKPFRQVDLAALRSFGEMRVKALAHIEGSFKTKARFLNKQPFSLPKLLQSEDSIHLAQSLREFLYMEHHAALQGKLLNYSLPIERRIQSGLAMLLLFTRRLNEVLYQFSPQFAALGLDPVLTLNACKLKEGDWVVLNPADSSITANQIKHGRLAIIKSIEPEAVTLQLLDITFRNGTFRYFHNCSLEPEVGKLYSIDPMADDLNADKILDSLDHVQGNTFYQWLISKPEKRTKQPELNAIYQEFTAFVEAFLKNRHRHLTKRQREAIAEQFDQPLLLVQGPPGTGKSYTLAWAILARVAAAAVQKMPCRVWVACKTHNAINVALKALSEAQQQIKNAIPSHLGGLGLQKMEIYKIVNEPNDPIPPGVKAIDLYRQRSQLESLLQLPHLVMGGTVGGLYNLMRYRALGGQQVDWRNKTFDWVVIDEASQMSLPEGVLAGAFLKPEGSMIVVGDHRQMPPIVAHPWKEEMKRSVVEMRPYISLFEYLVERDFPQVKLDESFRLHQRITEFLRDNIYVKDGIDFRSHRNELIPSFPPIHPYVDAVLKREYPIVVIEHTEQSSQQFNELELALTRPLVEACVKHLSLDGKNGIGVVVPHRAQRALLRSEFPELAEANSIDTVERFQGDERDVIIVSATASDPDYVLNEAEFLLNLNRLNVAISRPRKKLIVIASKTVIDLITSDLEIFEHSAIWKYLYYRYTPEVLVRGKVKGYRVTVRGCKA